jgi:gamma-glutamyltranspeptidase
MIGFPSPASIQADPAWPRRRSAPVLARNGMVAAAHPLITATGVGVLARGGNAVDAAVAAALTAGVVMPEMCGIGGDIFAIVHAPGRAGTAGVTTAVHGSGIAPRAASIDLMREHGDEGGTRMPYQGPLSVAVPGMLDACFSLLEHFGSRLFAEVVEPAIGYAADGFPLGPQGAAAIQDSADVLRRVPASAAVFVPADRALGVGSLLRQPDLARTLGEIATGGVDRFYRGDLAQRIAAAVNELGGALSVDDLADHATELTEPLTTTYRDYTIAATGLPSQGLILLEALNIVEHGTLDGPSLETAMGIHTLVESYKMAVADRLGYAGDPAFVDTPLATLLGKEWAARRFTGIDPARAATDVPAAPLEDGDTTYICVVDGAGMMVSLITSLSSAFGSGVVAGNTGVTLNNRAGRGFSLEPGHPNLYAPGKKTMHTLHCYLVSGADGSPLLVGGTPGGDGQPQWNLQVLASLIDGGHDVQAAVEAPRWTSWPSTDPSTLPHPYELRVEERASAETLRELALRGHDVRRQGSWSAGGAAQLIARDPETGALAGGSDPRAEGLAVGF